MPTYDESKHARDDKGKFAAMSTSASDITLQPSSTSFDIDGEEYTAETYEGTTMVSRDGEISHIVTREGETATIRDAGDTYRMSYPADTDDTDMVADTTGDFTQTPLHVLTRSGDGMIYDNDLGEVDFGVDEDGSTYLSTRAPVQTPVDAHADDVDAFVQNRYGARLLRDGGQTYPLSRGRGTIIMNRTVDPEQKFETAVEGIKHDPRVQAMIRDTQSGGIGRAYTDHVRERVAEAESVHEAWPNSMDRSEAWTNRNGLDAMANVPISEDSVSREVAEEHPQLIDHYIRSRFGADPERAWNDPHDDGVSVTFSAPFKGRGAQEALSQDTKIAEFDASLNGGGVESFDKGLERTYRDYGFDPHGEAQAIIQPDLSSATISRDLANGQAYQSPHGESEYNGWRGIPNPTGVTIVQDKDGKVRSGSRYAWIVENPDADSDDERIASRTIVDDESF